MKIDLNSIDLTQFIKREGVVAGEKVFLIFPNHIGVKWTPNNKIYRSSVWNAQGEPVSLGFKKFANLLENPEVFKQPPEDLRGCEIIEKLDGSLLIWSLYKNELIVRTRGTIDASEQETGGEIALLKEKYPLIEAALREHADKEGTAFYSVLTEWVGGAHKIVLNYKGGPDIYLIGCVNHDDYSYFSQIALDDMAVRWELKRPEIYKFDTLTSASAAIKALRGKEGTCMYHCNGQEITKDKSDWYKHLHRMKSEISNFEKVVDVFIAQNYPSYQDFYKFIETTLDFELAEQAKGHMSKTCDAYKRVAPILEGFKTFVEKVRKLSNRKEQAVAIIGAYGDTNRAAMVFRCLDGKSLTPDDIKKLIFQVMK